ncbi:MAG: S8 family peptidase [Pseudomonadota bacterium]|nr:S8 family peptidase [Pseudomonadota bacterium]
MNFKPSDAALALTGAQMDPTLRRDSYRVAQVIIKKYIEEAKSAEGVTDPDRRVDDRKTELSTQYVFARLEGPVIQKLVAIDGQRAEELAKAEAAALQRAAQSAAPAAKPKKRKGKTVVKEEPPLDEARFRTIHHIWPDFRVQSCIMRSIATVKADAAQRSFTALGEGITWAVMDSGIDADHPHFKAHGNIDRTSSYHADFTGAPTGAAPLKDEYGHGTHVAGIIAGEQIRTGDTPAKQMYAVCRERDQNNRPRSKELPLKQISGMAPKCELVSLKVLDKFGQGNASNLIAGICHIQLINRHGRELHIHGVNISLGYPFEAKWFACGHSPLCVEINRLVKSGVVVVIAAGNTGYGTLKTKEGESDASLDLTINDPGNAEYAITVGSTHRDMPHLYGVSYFSSKGPTGDGRYKPDLLAPGEKIVSCAAPKSKLVAKEVEEVESRDCGYFETSGTSMAAPHVSGVVAAFLSIRNEFIGESEKVKRIFTSTATDLGRDRSFQGHGLIDLMRAIQSV